MGLSRRPNRYNLDPFVAADTIKANYYYGRIDIEPDTKEGDKRAMLAVARGEEPDLDPALPWMLLMRGMFKFLYKEAIREDNRRRGRKKRNPGDPMPPSIGELKPPQWAEAFNIISVRYIETEYLKPPRSISEEKVNGRIIRLAVVVTNPGKGTAKSKSYIEEQEKQETINILRRMERHRLEVVNNAEVKKHLASLRDSAS